VFGANFQSLTLDLENFTIASRVDWEFDLSFDFSTADAPIDSRSRFANDRFFYLVEKSRP